jgi:hypothetical protein
VRSNGITALATGIAVAKELRVTLKPHYHHLLEMGVYRPTIKMKGLLGMATTVSQEQIMYSRSRRQYKTKISAMLH